MLAVSWLVVEAWRAPVAADEWDCVMASEGPPSSVVIVTEDGVEHVFPAGTDVWSAALSLIERGFAW